MGSGQNKFGRFLVGLSAGCLLAVSATGCGRTQSSLTSRVDVSEALEEGSSIESEQSMNERIAAERSKKKPSLAEATENIQVSAEEPKKSWKDRMLGKRTSQSSDFGKDPFLDDLDELIASEADHMKRQVRDRAEEVARTEAADLFGDVEKQAEQTLAALDKAATKPSAAAADLFDATPDDVFGKADTAVNAAREKVSNVAASGQRVVAEHSGQVVHRFDDLFGDGRQVQQTAAQEVNEPVAFEVSTDDAPVAMPAMPPVESAPPVSPEDLAGLFDDAPGLPEPAVAPAAPDLDIPEDPVTTAEAPSFDAPPEALFDTPQQDAVVTSNKPAAIPSLPPAPKQAPIAQDPPSESDFTAMERIGVDPYEDPIFAEPTKELPPIEDIPPVEIPKPEPAPRFAAVPEQPVQAPTPVTPAVVSQPVPHAAQTHQTASAAVLPNVNWQAQPAQSVLRAPSEWTAWFLMGGAALIILLLFAPSRRTE